MSDAAAHRATHAPAASVIAPDNSGAKKKKKKSKLERSSARQTHWSAAELLVK
jgi:hypothetical protein